jgi:hypothetical protein
VKPTGKFAGNKLASRLLKYLGWTFRASRGLLLRISQAIGGVDDAAGRD